MTKRELEVTSPRRQTNTKTPAPVSEKLEDECTEVERGESSSVFIEYAKKKFFLK
jgi:hypothetical protein